VPIFDQDSGRGLLPRVSHTEFVVEPMVGSIQTRSCLMTSSEHAGSVTRRTALAGLGAGSLGLALATTARQASAQDADALANHPIVGVWNVMTPRGPVLALFFPDGTVLITPQVAQVGPNGVTFVTSNPGVWEPVGERSAHFTVVQIHSDATGTFTGSVTIDGYPVVSEDGLSLFDDQSQGMITIRDAAGAIVQEIPTAGDPPVTGMRMGVGAPGFPEATTTPTL